MTSKRAKKRDDGETPFIEGLKGMSQYMGRSPQTIRHWITYHGFPAAKLPNGIWATDPELIRRWLVQRGIESAKQMREAYGTEDDFLERFAYFERKENKKLKRKVQRYPVEKELFPSEKPRVRPRKDKARSDEHEPRPVQGDPIEGDGSGAVTGSD